MIHNGLHFFAFKIYYTVSYDPLVSENIARTVALLSQMGFVICHHSVSKHFQENISAQIVLKIH